MEVQSFDHLNADDVLGLVESGKVTAEDAISIEQQGKNRKTLVSALEKLITKPHDSEDKNNNGSEKEPKVTLQKNIKYLGKWHFIGDEIKIDEKDYDAFVKAGIIEE